MSEMTTEKTVFSEEFEKTMESWDAMSVNGAADLSHGDYIRCRAGTDAGAMRTMAARCEELGATDMAKLLIERAEEQEGYDGEEDAAETVTQRGLRADIFKHEGRTYCNGTGVSARCDAVTIVACGDTRADLEPVFEGARVFEPTDRAPAVGIIWHCGLPIAVEVELDDAGKWQAVRRGAGPMMGGCFVSTSDGRFGDIAGARIVPLHDRFE